jgi:hypothetical protein
MAKRPAEQIAEAASDTLTKSGEAAENSRAAFQELTRAYQELASKNAKNLTTATQALAAVSDRVPGIAAAADQGRG